MISKSPLQLPLVHLYAKEAPLTAEFLYQRLLPTSIGIAISIDHANVEVMGICKDKGLSVFFWTMKDDEPEHLPPQIATMQQAYFFLFSLGMNGIIT